MSPRTAKPVSTDKRFRRARADEADLLNEMTLAGLRYWGHHQSHPTLYEESASSLPTLGNQMKVVSDPESVGFYAEMGASHEETREVAPGFSLGVFWYELA